MSGRARLAAGILVLWTATLGWQVKRLYFRPITQIVAQAARTLPPGTSYYRVYEGERQVGWAQRHLDTLPSASGFILREQLEARLTAPGSETSTSILSEAVLSPTLTLRAFEIQTTGIVGELTLHGTVSGDTLLELYTTRRSAVDTLRLPMDAPVILSGAWPLRFVAQGQLEPGQRFSLPLFDPYTSVTRDVQLEVLAREIRTYPDSATDQGPLWVAARLDTVEAWQVRQIFGGLDHRSWVDEDGRFLDTHTVSGLRLERTAFEMAFYGDSVPHGDNRQPTDQAFWDVHGRRCHRPGSAGRHPIRTSGPQRRRQDHYAPHDCRDPDAGQR